MNDLQLLFAGFAVFWAGIFVYLLWLQARLHSVQRDLGRLEERLEERLAEEEASRGTPEGAAEAAENGDAETPRV